jgi:hypothetical protein
VSALRGMLEVKGGNMKLDAFLKAGKISIDDFAAKAKTSGVTIRNVSRGMRINKYDVAKRISVATGGKVTVPEICES